MAILVDFNNVVFATLLASPSDHGFQDDLIRHITLMSLLSFKKRFGKKYGEMILCCDGGNPWRKDFFPYYKIRRIKKPKEERIDDGVDWEAFYNIVNNFREELKQFMPYKVIHIPRVEGDDAIAVLVRTIKEPHIIISNDKDFGQLQKYPDVSQYASLKGKEIKIDDPALFLKEQLIRGDSGDDVPNLLSDDDVFVVKEKRQKSIMAKKLVNYLKDDLTIHFDQNKINRNTLMIDLDSIPEEYVNKILSEYESQKNKSVKRQDIFNYFVAKKLNKLLEDIQLF